MTYILTTEAMRVVQRNERGAVTKRVKYRKGDEVDPGLLPDGRLEALLESGSLVEGDELPEGEEVDLLRQAGNTAGGGTNVTQPMPEGGPVESSDVSEEDTDEEETTPANDRYDSMEYADLRREAQERTGDGSGNVDALKARLRGQDRIDADQD